MNSFKEDSGSSKLKRIKTIITAYKNYIHKKEGKRVVGFHCLSNKIGTK